MDHRGGWKSITIRRLRSPERRALRTRLVLAATIATVFGLVFVPAALAGPTGHTIRTTQDFTGVVLTCPTENVVFSGTATLVETATTAPSGETIAHLLFNLRGLSAVGQSSGTRYRVVGVTSTGFSFSIGTPQTADTSRFTQTWLLIPLKGGTPLSFHEVLTVIHDANGNLVALVSQPPADCN
jgi:hypothetical protein